MISHDFPSDWWFETCFLLFHSVGNVLIPTGPKSIIFQRGRYTNHQPAMIVSHDIPSGKHTINYGKSQLLMEQLTISTGPFSIANCECLPEGSH